MEQINLASDDDITNFTDEQQVSVDRVNGHFRQQSKLKGIEREFTIFNDIQCYQRVVKKHAGKQKFRINLSYLDPKPERDFILADNWLITAAISAVLSFLIVYAGWFSQHNLNHPVLIIMAIASVCFCCIAFLIAILRTNDRLVFYSRFGHAPILEFINNNPEKEHFKTFINTLQKHIVHAQNTAAIPVTDQLTLEIQELRRLKNETVITESVYERAKRRIFKNSAFKA